MLVARRQLGRARQVRNRHGGRRVLGGAAAAEVSEYVHSPACGAAALEERAGLERGRALRERRRAAQARDRHRRQRARQHAVAELARSAIAPAADRPVFDQGAGLVEAACDRRGVGHTGHRHRGGPVAGCSVAELAELVHSPAFDRPTRAQGARARVARRDGHRVLQAGDGDRDRRVGHGRISELSRVVQAPALDRAPREESAGVKAPCGNGYGLARVARRRPFVEAAVDGAARRRRAVASRLRGWFQRRIAGGHVTDVGLHLQAAAPTAHGEGEEPEGRRLRGLQRVIHQRQRAEGGPVHLEGFRCNGRAPARDALFGRARGVIAIGPPECGSIRHGLAESRRRVHLHASRNHVGARPGRPVHATACVQSTPARRHARGIRSSLAESLYNRPPCALDSSPRSSSRRRSSSRVVAPSRLRPHRRRPRSPPRRPSNRPRRHPRAPLLRLRPSRRPRRRRRPRSTRSSSDERAKWEDRQQGRARALDARDARRRQGARRQGLPEREGRDQRRDRGQAPQAGQRRSRQVPPSAGDAGVLRLQADDDRPRRRPGRGLVHGAARARRSPSKGKLLRDERRPERPGGPAQHLLRPEAQGVPRQGARALRQGADGRRRQQGAQAAA